MTKLEFAAGAVAGALAAPITTAAQPAEKAIPRLDISCKTVPSRRLLAGQESVLKSADEVIR